MAEDDEWEYEYDFNSSETFLIDLDLTTANRNFRAGTASRHKRLNDLDTSQSSNKKQKKGKKNDQTAQTEDVANSPAALEESNLAEPTADAAGEATPEDLLHILDLTTNNPVISYRGQVYSCSWLDTIGTTMFFSPPGTLPLYDADIKSKDFDMIGLSRIKLVGREAKLTPIEQADGESSTVVKTPGHSLGTIKRGNAKLNSDLRKQASFLEQLMNIKKNRGEGDNIHVVMNDKIAKSIADDKLKHDIQRRAEQIDELNRRVVSGDAEALEKLEQIYTGKSLEESDAEEDVEDQQIERSRRKRRRPQKTHEPHSPVQDLTEDENRPRILGTASPSPPPASPSQTPSTPIALPDPSQRQQTASVLP